MGPLHLVCSHVIVNVEFGSLFFHALPKIQLGAQSEWILAPLADAEYLNMFKSSYLVAQSKAFTFPHWSARYARLGALLNH